MTARPYRHGRVHVCERECDTCVFRPGNLMRLQPGRLRAMVDDARERDAAITCHSTLYGQHPDGEAVCRGFFDRYPTQPLQIADRLGLVEWQRVLPSPYAPGHAEPAAQARRGEVQVGAPAPVHVGAGTSGS